MPSNEVDPDQEYYPDGMRRRIERSIFCDRCGYNLRTLPHAGVCPECGNEYNARTLKMTGILIPQAIPFPGSDLIATVLAMGAGLFSLQLWRGDGNIWYFVLAGVFGVFATAQFVVFYLGLVRFLHCRRLLRDIRVQNES